MIKNCILRKCRLSCTPEGSGHIDFMIFLTEEDDTYVKGICADDNGNIYMVGCTKVGGSSYDPFMFWITPDKELDNAWRYHIYDDPNGYGAFSSREFKEIIFHEGYLYIAGQGISSLSDRYEDALFLLKMHPNRPSTIEKIYHQKSDVDTSFLTDLKIAPNGFIYTCGRLNGSNGCIGKFSTDLYKDYIRQVKSSGDESLGYLFGVDVDDNNNMYTVGIGKISSNWGYVVSKWSENGALKASTFIYSGDTYVSPHCITVDTNHVYVAGMSRDADTSQSRLIIYKLQRSDLSLVRGVRYRESGVITSLCLHGSSLYAIGTIGADNLVVELNTDDLQPIKGVVFGTPNFDTIFDEGTAIIAGNILIIGIQLGVRNNRVAAIAFIDLNDFPQGDLSSSEYNITAHSLDLSKFDFTDNFIQTSPGLQVTSPTIHTESVYMDATRIYPYYTVGYDVVC